MQTAVDAAALAKAEGITLFAWGTPANLVQPRAISCNQPPCILQPYVLEDARLAKPYPI